MPELARSTQTVENSHKLFQYFLCLLQIFAITLWLILAVLIKVLLVKFATFFITWLIAKILAWLIILLLTCVSYLVHRT